MATMTEKAKTVEMVSVKIPMDMNNKGDQFVSVNNYNAQIRRGEVVEVPWNAANVIRRSEKQKLKAFRMMEDLSAKGERVSKL